MAEHERKRAVELRLLVLLSVEPHVGPARQWLGRHHSC
jgi:hypothetical protein